MSYEDVVGLPGVLATGIESTPGKLKDQKTQENCYLIRGFATLQVRPASVRPVNHADYYTREEEEFVYASIVVIATVGRVR